VAVVGMMPYHTARRMHNRPTKLELLLLQYVLFVKVRTTFFTLSKFLLRACGQDLNQSTVQRAASMHLSTKTCRFPSEFNFSVSRQAFISVTFKSLVIVLPVGVESLGQRGFQHRM
jgi:hypothetical protein